MHRAQSYNQSPGTGHWTDAAAAGEEGEHARREIERAVRLQEEAGLDILAHGAYDRADMVEVRGFVCLVGCMIR